MKQIIFDALTKLQDIQRDLLGTDINVEIHTYLDKRTNLPWLTVFVAMEGFYSLSEDDIRSHCIAKQISLFDFLPYEENERYVKASLEKIENFINTHKQ